VEWRPLVNRRVATRVRKALQTPQEPLVLCARGLRRVFLKRGCKAGNRPRNGHALGGGRHRVGRERNSLLRSPLPVPTVGLLPLSGQGPGFVPIGFAGLLAAEFSGERAGDVDHAAALLPAAAPFFKLAGTGVFG